jgi:thiopeptide-type bacteriocin biosynthesis protein
MPANRLTVASDTLRAGAPPATLTCAVLQVLAGAAPDEAAAAAGVTITDLDTATRLFRVAGQAALEAQAEDEWYNVAIRWPAWSAAEQAAVTSIPPALRQLTEAGLIAGWWFLRKHPCWRLRLRPGPGANRADAWSAADTALEELRSARVIESWQRTPYEAETFAFGGPAGIGLAHDHFCADSSAVLNYLGRDNSGIGRRELSVLLCNSMYSAAGLDWFEIGDVWNTVSALRPPAEHAGAPRHQSLTGQLRSLLHADTSPSGPLFASDAPLSFAAEWTTAFSETGRALSAAAASGVLSRGLRHILAHIVIFHWNRLGLSANHQALLAAAAREATLPGAQPCPSLDPAHLSCRHHAGRLTETL